MHPLINLITERAFSKVPGWWPRVYLTLILFNHFKETNYVAPSYMLRRKAEEVGLGKTTLYKGLSKLIEDGIIEKKDSLYILKQRGFYIMMLYTDIEGEIIKCIESKKKECYEELKEKIDKLPEDIEFENIAKTYFRTLINEAIEILSSLSEAKTTYEKTT
ncbi:MAG: hypothetical protein N3G48_07660 [Sulfolobales archaeon]|nr:hypothetical protein [Sulfolobales archaeon]